VKISFDGSPPKEVLFVVRSFYNILVLKDDLCFTWKSVWRTKVSFERRFFLLGWQL